LKWGRISDSLSPALSSLPNYHMDINHIRHVQLSVVQKYRLGNSQPILLIFFMLES
jgi:hypothetical protein